MRCAAFGLMLTGLAAPCLAQDADPYADADPVYAPAILADCLGRAAQADAQTCIGLASATCMKTAGGGTTVGMNACLSHEVAQWDDLLNASYAALLAADEAADKDLAGMGSAAAPSAPALRDMQRAWIGFRDAACLYEARRWQGGTGAGPAANSCMLGLTARQALRLKDHADAVR